MKSILSKIVIIFSSFFLMTSCYTNIIEDFGSGGGDGDGDGNGGNGSSDLIFSDYNELQQFAYASERVFSVSFHAAMDWRVDFPDMENRRWLSVEQSSGTSGDYVLTVYVDKNTWGYDRQGVINLSCGSSYESIYVSQSAYTEWGDIPVLDGGVSYDAIVDRIVRYPLSSDGSVDRSQSMVWQFYYNDNPVLVSGIMGDYWVTDEEDNSSAIHLSDYSFNRYNSSLDVHISVSELRGGTVEMTDETGMSCILDDEGRIKYGQGYSNDIQSGESYDFQVSAFYSDGYIQWMEYFMPSMNSTLKGRFFWDNSSLSAVGTENLYDASFHVSENRSYTSFLNDKANVNFNYIVDIEDNPIQLVGLLGNRSQYLVASTEDVEDGEIVNYSYEFDSQNRVVSIRTFVSSGMNQGEMYLYEVYYR